VCLRARLCGAIKKKKFCPCSRKVHPGGSVPSGGTGGIYSFRLVPGVFCITHCLRLSDTEPKEFHRSTLNNYGGPNNKIVSIETTEFFYDLQLASCMANWKVSQLTFSPQLFSVVLISNFFLGFKSLKQKRDGETKRKRS
jgi:hypothetical protein